MKEPGLDDRWRDKDGQIREKRNDTHAGTLSNDYPEFEQFRVDKKLGNIKKELGLPPDASLKEVRRKLRWASSAGSNAGSYTDCEHAELGFALVRYESFVVTHKPNVP